jgi:UDP-N-acetylglucosamine-peptide-n-acetylglucosaminyltransferase
LDNLPLYRCLYIDPKSGYISIAQRDRATFFAEAWYDKKMADYKTICDQAEKDWDSYLEEISKLTKVVKYEFTQLTEAVFEILQKLQHNGVQKTPSNDMQKSPRDDVLEVLTFILQPLRYLVKHTAFQEEQECRMIYITSLEDTRIKSEWDNKRMYLEYAAPVKDALDKIYLSPGAQPHEDFFKKELPHLAKTGKIRHSQNPFRNK